MKLFYVHITMYDADSVEIVDTEEASSPWAAISKVWRAHRKELEGSDWSVAVEEVD
jgi:hypothetical protein